jgi:DNA repair protein RecO (recombination protein O)
MRVDLEPAFVLHQRRYGETSQLLEVLSLAHGRVGLVARGARRQRSPWLGLLHPFRPVLLSWVGGGDLATLRAAEADGPPWALSGTRLYCGFYLNELCLRLLQRHCPCPTIHGLYGEALTGLADWLGEAGARRAGAEEPLLRRFELRLLAELGYGLPLAPPPGTGWEPTRIYHFVHEHGPEPQAPAGVPSLPVSGRTLIALAGTLAAGGRTDPRAEPSAAPCADPHAEPSAGDRAEPFADPLAAAEVRREAKLLLRFALAPYLGAKPLASRALFT